MAVFLLLEISDDIEQWLNTEREFWKPLIDAFRVRQPEINSKSRQGYFNLVCDVYINLFNEIQDDINSLNNVYKNTPGNQKDIEYYLSEIKNTLISNYVGDSIIKKLVSKNKLSQLISTLAESDTVVAFFAMACVSDDELHFKSRESIISLFEVAAFEKGYKKNITPYTKELTALKEKWDKEALAAQAERDSLKEEYDELVFNIYEWKLNTSKSFAEQVENQDKTFVDLKEKYEKEMQLKAPVEYWRKKKKNHYIASFCLSFMLIIYFTTGGKFIYGEYKNLQSNGYSIDVLTEKWNNNESLKPEPKIKTVVKTERNGTKSTEVFNDEKNLEDRLFKIALYVLMATIFVWVARILVRILFSQLHLAEDAGERAVMITVYLAMLKDGEAVQDSSDRELILKSIFRAAPIGMIKDDAMPMHPIEVITRQAR